MPFAPVTILGGLPVIAEVWFSRGDGWMTDDDAGVDGLYWIKRDGTRGKHVSRKIWDRLDKIDYWQCDVVEQASDWLAYSDAEEREMVQLT